MSEYLKLLIQELHSRKSQIPFQTVDSIYFGGGTPSLFPAEYILAFISELKNIGFKIKDSAELTIEINPGTIDDQRLDLYREAGINRYSLGVQSFNDDYLMACGREHSAQQTRNDINFLKSNGLNYSLDLLFGLPHQDKNQLEWEIEQFLSFDPPHISAYNLTIPTGHPMNTGRASDSVQAEMFDLLEDRLKIQNILRYELSNFSKPGRESQHNLIYWNDSNYWGLGISAHSYVKSDQHPLGQRFWNAKTAKQYEQQCELDFVPDSQIERLKTHEALTDYCHTQLRKVVGLDYRALELKFSLDIKNLVTGRAKEALSLGLVEESDTGIRLTQKGRQLANPSFLKFTFLPEELSIPQ